MPLLGWFILLTTCALPPFVRSFDSDGKGLWATLAPAGQQHVLQFWDSLGADEKAQLKADVESVDLDDLQKWYNRTQGRYEPFFSSPSL